MTDAIEFNKVLMEWSERFISRSMRNYMHFVKASGLSLSHFGILMHLYYRGANDISEMGEHLDITVAAASQLINRLVEEQLVDRAESPKDRRVRQLTLTAKGRALIEKAIEVRNQWIERLPLALSEKQLKTISVSLRDLITAERSLDNQ
ncbi:MAG: MarR family transcriptional regulator [Anaerolineaceae bacterium]|jgi:DNA-binding MarR family transcriptional regulator|nr:MAG: MarR family transcriptional regulator [Anaerolineaceae bacterium]GJQ37536.1 MAG: hypothetical protein JETCAE01_35460 [Anaerolineaceae bacterium]